MSTRSLTRVHIGNKSSAVIVAMYRQSEGYFECMGQDLVDFLDGMKITSGINMAGNPKKYANGMDCLAAQLVAHFKTEPGDIYLMSENATQEYNYDIYEVDGKIELVGEGNGETRVLVKVESKPKYTEVAEFVYLTRDGTALWRKIGLVEQNDARYLKGVDLNDGEKFKCFRVDRIVGGEEKIIIEKL